MADKIRIGIFDELKITQEGLCALLEPVEDFEITLKVELSEQLFEKLKTEIVNVLIIHVRAFNTEFNNLILQLSAHFPQVKVLVISASHEEETVLKTIKSGAKGFLTRDTSRNDLVEAVFMLRNGHDYFSNSITVLLVNKYVKKLKADDDRIDVRSLSTREIEIMKMWGNSYTNKEIADKLFLSVRTVETHKNHIMQKLNLKTSVDMVKFAIRNNIIEL